MTNNDCVDVNIRYTRTSLNDFGSMTSSQNKPIDCSNDQTSLNIKDDIRLNANGYSSTSLRERSISISNGLDDEVSYQQRYCPCCLCRNDKGMPDASYQKELILDLLEADYENFFAMDRYLGRRARHFGSAYVPLVRGNYCYPRVCCQRKSACKYLSASLGDNDHNGRNDGLPLTRSKADGKVNDENHEENNGKMQTKSSNSKMDKPDKNVQEKSGKSENEVSSLKPNSPVSPVFKYIPRSTPKYVLCGFCNRVYSLHSMEIHSKRCKNRLIPRKRLGMDFDREMESPSMVKLCESNPKVSKERLLKRENKLQNTHTKKDLINCRVVDIGKESVAPLKSKISRAPSKKVLPPSQDVLPVIDVTEKSTSTDRKKSVVTFEPDLFSARKTRKFRKSPRQTLSAEKHVVRKEDTGQKESNQLIPHPPPSRACNLCGEALGTQLSFVHDKQCPAREKKDTERKPQDKKENVEEKQDEKLIPHPSEFQECTSSGDMYGSPSLSIHAKKCSTKEDEKIRSEEDNSSTENNEIKVEDYLS